MDLLSALSRGATPASASLDGYPLGWIRVTQAWDTGPKCLDEHLFYLVDSGELVLDMSQERRHVASGGYVLLPPGTPFRARSGSTAPTFWRARLRLPGPWPGAPTGTGARELEPVIIRLVSECSQAPSPARDASMRGGLLQLLATLQRLAGAGHDQRLLTPAERRRLELYADSHPDATPRDLMRQLELTLDYGTRLFTTSYGCPPRRWLLERRMHRAAVRVSEGEETIAHIADDLGYQDVRLFVRQFRAVLGQPPARFRALIRRSGDRP